jgi:UDP-glucose 4-epimerase
MKQIAIVTGGAGFIGSHLVDILVKNNYKVIIIDNLIGGRLDNLINHKNDKNVEFVEKDIRELKVNDTIFKNIKYIFHFAGIGDIVPSIQSPAEYMSVNVQGTINVLECARINNVYKFIYAASSSCYGLAETPTNESHKINTKYPYALSKFQGEQAVLHWFNLYKLLCNSIRIFNAYGTRSRTSGAYGAVFGVFLKQKLAGKPFTIVGDGTQTRDFVYVTDVANAFYLAAINETSGQIFNLGADNPQSINHLTNLLGGEKVFIPKRLGEPECTWADISKIKSILNWSPKVSFEQGVNEILDNIEYWNDAPLWDSNSIKKATKTWFQYMS